MVSVSPLQPLTYVTTPFMYQISQKVYHTKSVWIKQVQKFKIYNCDLKHF